MACARTTATVFQDGKQLNHWDVVERSFKPCQLVLLSFLTHEDVVERSSKPCQLVLLSFDGMWPLRTRNDIVHRLNLRPEVGALCKDVWVYVWVL